MWWLSQSTTRLQAKLELSASEKHVPTSCLSSTLHGIHALNSDVLPGASTRLFYQHTSIPKGNTKCLKYLSEEEGGGCSCRLCQWWKHWHPRALKVNVFFFFFFLNGYNEHVCTVPTDRNKSTSLTEISLTKIHTKESAESLQNADCTDSTQRFLV